MAVNKVVYGSNVLIDISDSTVDENNLFYGFLEYDKSGKKIEGTYVPKSDTGSKTEYIYKTVNGAGNSNLSISGLNAEPSAVFVCINSQIQLTSSYIVNSVVFSDNVKKTITGRQQNNKNWGIEYVSTPTKSYSNGTLTLYSGKDSYVFSNITYNVLLVYDAVSSESSGEFIDSNDIDSIFN